jgi:SAM-dependent methyltransferase
MYVRVQQVSAVVEPLQSMQCEILSLKDNIAILKDEIVFVKNEFSSLKNVLQQHVRIGPKQTISHELVQAIASLAEENALYRAFAGTDRPMSSPPAPVSFGSSLCHQQHFMLDQFRFWLRAMKIRPRFYRKWWEFFYIAQTLFERGLLTAGKRGIGFGIGREPLPALFASFGVEIVASDQSLEAAERSGWVQSGQHSHELSALNESGICTEATFSRLVSFREVDMNDIPSSLDEEFDFCWSSCSLEHLGSLRHGLDFIENSLRTLKSGGVAIHTTEFNLTSNVDTLESAGVSIYRRCDIDEFLEKMRARDFIVSPIDWTLGEGFAETVVDMPPYRIEPHIRLNVGEFDVTSIGLIIQKPS